MLVPYNTTPPTASNTFASAINISTSANLSITMKINTKAEPKKRTRYRPVERQDEVIVLQRPYRPSASTPQSNKFEEHVPVFAVSTSKAKLRTCAALKRTDEDLVRLGAQFGEEGRDGCNDLVDAERGGYNALMDAGRGGYNDLMDAGRDGYNDLLDGREDNSTILSDFSTVAQRPRLSPMQRFLNECGAWNTCELRES
jgi:hypothetical protein